MVGPLPRQAEGRDVHAADQAARGPRERRAVAHDRRAVGRARVGRGRAQHAADDPAPPPPAAGAARRLRPPRRSGADDRGGLRGRGPQRHRLPGRGPRRRRALRRDAGDRRGDELLLRQPGLQRSSAQAQDHDLGLRTPLQRCRDQLHRARRRDPRRGRGLRGPRGRWALVGAAARPRARRLRREGRGAAGAARADRRLAGGPPLPRLARQGAAQVHGRRHRPGGNARARRAASRAHAARLPPPAAPGDRSRPHGRRPPARRRADGRRAGARRARERDADDRARRARCRVRHRPAGDAPAEPRPHRSRGGRRGARASPARRARLPDRCQPDPRRLDRVHRASRTATSR